MKIYARIIVVLLLIYLFFFQLLAAWNFTTDDTFISLKYAKNLLDYGELTWHPDMPVVEGYSNFLFVILGAGALKLGLDPVLSLKLFSCAMLGLTVFTLYGFTRLWLMPQFAFIPALWLLWYNGQILWSVSGLETSTYQLFVLLSAYSLFRGLGYAPVTVQTQSSFCNHQLKLNLMFFLAGGLCLSLAGLTRPEAPALMLTWLLCVFANRGQFKLHGRRLWIAIGITAAVIAVIYVPYFMWRWHFYGHLFPNSVYCKWLSNVDVGVLDLNYVKLTIPLMLVALPYMVMYRDYRLVYLIAPSLLYLLLLYDADSVVGYFNRLFLAAFVLVIPLPLLGVSALVKRFANSNSSSSLIYAVSLAVAMFIIPSFSLQSYQAFSHNSVLAIDLRNHIANWLYQRYPQNTRIVLGDCGQIPYLTKFPIIDSYCLNSAKMTSASINRSYRRFVNWVLDEQPKLIILMAWLPGDKTIHSPAAKEFLNNDKFNQNYQMKKEFKTPNPNDSYSYTVYELNK